MIYMFLAEGFEEVEALCPLDLLRRAGADVKTVGVGGEMITGSHGICVRADMREDEFSDSDPEMIILPGGMPGTKNLGLSLTVGNAIDNAYKNNAYIAAICAAPSLLGERGLLDGREATCFPGFEGFLLGARLSDKRVVADGKIITAAGMGVALDFGLALVAALYGEEKAELLKKAVLADK
ncbi:MAG: DJ-1 family glyoxalase III [Clostridia bacterium]|nr:DJ-1 family glyoxalase III [Clostridia bacterium]